MNKEVELSKQQKDEDKFLIAKILDKIKFSNNRNRIECSEFLDLRQQRLVREALEIRKLDSYNLVGGYDDAERKILITFPYNINFDINNVINQFLCVIEVNLPNELKMQYEHRNYLGALMKLGIKREKIGDILVRNDGADIIVKKDIAEYVMSNISLLTRFQKSKIKIKEIEKLTYIKKEKELMKINVPSMRLDCIVGELAKCSRADALNLLNEERVFVNFKEEIRPSKLIVEGDYITIRGKGRFKVNKVLGNTKSGRINLEIEK